MEQRRQAGRACCKQTGLSQTEIHRILCERSKGVSVIRGKKEERQKSPGVEANSHGKVAGTSITEAKLTAHTAYVPSLTNQELTAIFHTGDSLTGL